MSSSSHEESDRDHLLGDKRSIPRNYSQFASVTFVLHFVRSLKLFPGADVEKKRYSEIIPSSPHSVSHVEPENTEFKISPSELKELVEEENLVRLQELGGVQGIAEALITDLKRGIDSQDTGLRCEVFGTNGLHNPPVKRHFFNFVWRAVLDFKILILIICGSVSVGLGIKVDGPKEGWMDGGGILIEVFFAIFVVAISSYWHNKILEKKLQDDSYNIKIFVVRDGHRQEIPISDIVVGDVVCLKYGDKVPAHGLVLKEDSLKLKAEQASGRGQGDSVELDRTNHEPFLFSGTEVLGGSALMLVTSVGVNARWGQEIDQSSHGSRKPTPLQVQLEELDSTMHKVGYVVTSVVLLLILRRALPFKFMANDEEEGKESANLLAKIYGIVRVLVGLATTLVIIPDLRVLFLMLTCAYAAKNLNADDAVLFQLRALETMSFANIICINKTGTLTTNQTKVEKFCLGKDYVAEGAYTSIAPEVKVPLQQVIFLNTSNHDEILFSPTEKAILSWAVQDLKADEEEIKKSYEILHSEAFSSESKQGWCCTKRKTDNKIQVHLKGAAKLIFRSCSHYYNASGDPKALDANKKMELEKIVEGMAAGSLNCIAFAHKEVDEMPLVDADKVKMPKNGMILLGIVGISNPCRPGVKNAVQYLQNAGVKVKMITGDDIFTAKVIATECGILTSDSSGAAIEGEEFQNFTKEERLNKVDEICVMAGSSPYQKFLMVESLKQKNHVVAVVGVGASDSSAMKEADIGLPMLVECTKVVEGISNFDLIPKVLMSGRCVYSSMQKFVQFRLTAAFAAPLANSFGTLESQELPLTAAQLLWVSLITGTLACLAFTTEKPTEELMKKRPVCTTDPLITDIMLRNILPQTLYQVALLLTIIQFKDKSILGTDVKITVTFIFTLYVFCQVFNQVNARKLEKKNVFEKIHTNRLFLLIIVAIILLQTLLVETLKMIADTQRLNWSQWGLCIGIAALTLPIGWLSRFIPLSLVRGTRRKLASLLTRAPNFAF